MQFLPITHDEVKRAIGKTSPLTPFEEFYAYCCADLMECLLLTVQTKLDNRKRPLSMDDIPVQLLVIATHLGQTKWHYWNSVREFTTLLDSLAIGALMQHISWLYRNTVPLQRILRFSELFILPACLPNGGKRWYIGKSFEFASLSASYNLVSMRLQSIQQVKHISDIGDCYASVRKELYGELDITSDMVARLPELAILL